MKNKKIIRMPRLTGARQASYKKGLTHFQEGMVKSAKIIFRNPIMQAIECKLEETTESDEKTQDRKRAYHLNMTYKAYSKRKAKLMSQAEKVKETT